MGIEQKQQKEILTSLNAISMSLWAFKFNKEWNRSDTLLKGIKKAQSKEGNAHKANDIRIPYHLSIKHLEDVISIFFFSSFPRLYNHFFLTISQILNVQIMSSFQAPYPSISLPFLSLVKHISFPVWCLYFDCSCSVTETNIFLVGT